MRPVCGSDRSFDDRIEIPQGRARLAAASRCVSRCCGPRDGDDERGRYNNRVATYSSALAVHLVPYFKGRDLRRIQLRQVQAFYDHCSDRGRPPAARTIEKILTTLSQILSHALRSGLVESNPVDAWKRSRRRRRRSLVTTVRPDQVLSLEELQRFLATARRENACQFPMILFLADTGARLGEAVAVRWTDIDLERGLVRIARSYSGGRFLGPTKSGRERDVELTTRLRETLEAIRPDLYGEESLAFPNDRGRFIDQTNFRRRAFDPIVRKVLGKHRRFTPHGLRHTFASIHLSRGTNLLWVQRQGGWTSPAVLLATYAHFIPTEVTGYADALAAPDGPTRPLLPRAVSEQNGVVADSSEDSGTSMVGPRGIEPRTDGLKEGEEPPRNDGDLGLGGLQGGAMGCRKRHRVRPRMATALYGPLSGQLSATREGFQGWRRGHSSWGAGARLMRALRAPKRTPLP